MERLFIAVIAAAALLAGSATLAQQRSAPGTAVSDSELSTFADIYVDLQETATKFERELANIETEQEAREVQSKMQEASLETVAQHGWTAEKYNSVADAINADPELAEKTLELIDERTGSASPADRE